MPDSPREPNAPCPMHVSVLGYGGLMPFVGLATLMLADPPRAATWGPALLGYGAVILAFVGALHWGFAMACEGLDSALRRRAFAWSVVPALLGWLALVLGGAVGSVILVLGLAVHLSQDHRLAKPARLPAWYLPLRWRLTVVASLCLLAYAAVSASRG